MAVLSAFSMLQQLPTQNLPDNLAKKRPFNDSKSHGTIRVIENPISLFHRRCWANMELANFSDSV
jgi:hypothetical protein